MRGLASSKGFGLAAVLLVMNAAAQNERDRPPAAQFPQAVPSQSSAPASVPDAANPAASATAPKASPPAATFGSGSEVAAPSAGAAPRPFAAPGAAPYAPSPQAEYAAAQAEWQRAYATWWAAHAEQGPTRRWYGWQTLAVDIPAMALWLVGAESSSSSNSGDVPIAVGFFGYLLGAPIVHAAHGQWGKAGASFAFRAGTTVVAVVGAVGCIDETLFTDRGCSAGYETLLVVGSLGIPASIAVDAAVIAREDVPSGEVSVPMVRPWVAPRGRGGGVIFGGAF